MRVFAKSLVLSLLLLLVFSSAASASQETYTVKSGDTLWGISQTCGVSVNDIKAWNNLSSDLLHIGQTLIINNNAAPAASSTTVTPAPAAPAADAIYIVQAGDTLWTIAARYGVTVEQLMQANQLSSEALYIGNRLIIPNAAAPSRSGESVNNARVLEIAARYLGTPYRYGGQAPGGFDCSGFVKYVYGQVGIELPRTAASQYGLGTEVSREQLIPGDLVFFRCGGGAIDHVGIYSGNNQFIHSSSPRSGGVIYSSMSESYYARSYTGARRILH